MLKYIIVIVYLLLGCHIKSNKEEKTFKNPTPQKSSLFYKNKIDSTFNIWKSDEIKAGKIQAICPEYGSNEFQLFLEEPHDNDNRFAYSRTLKKLYSDFNEDGILDGLIVFERQDCEYGNGYVGDNQVPILFISKDNIYYKDSVIIKDMQNAINSNALNIFMPAVAYVEVHSVIDNHIKGIYYDWQEGDSSGGPTFKKNFKYNYKTKALSIL